MTSKTSTAPIELRSKVPEEQPMAQLERYVNVGGAQTRRRAQIPIVEDEEDPKVCCKLYKEFLDLIDASRLNLSTGALRFEFFRQCLRGGARDNWDSVLTDHGAGRGANDFRDCITEWFGKYMESTAFQDQK